MSVQIQLKRSTASAWTSANPTLAVGEIGYETDTTKFKIGNGSTAWTSLSYANANLSVATLNDLGDVTITSSADGDFLRWNGSAWINDAVNLSTDTIGSYVQSLVAGTGVTLANNSGEGATPTITVDTTVIQARVAGVSDTEIGYLDGVTSAIQTQINAKSPLASPTFTGTVTLPSGTSIGTVSSTEIGYLDGVTSAIQTQLDSKLASADLTESAQDAVNTALTAGTGVTKVYDDASNTITIAIGQAVGTTSDVSFRDLTVSGNLTVSGTTTTINSTAVNVKNQVVFEGTTEDNFETTLTVVDPTADRTITFPDATTTVVGTDTTQTLSNKTLTTPVINGPTITATGQTPVIHGILLPATHNIIFEGTTDDAFETTLYVVDPTADRTVSLPDATTTLVGKDTTDTLTNKTLTSPKINEDVVLAATATELNILDGATLSTTELNYVDGVTSAIQTQIDTKAPSASPTFTGTVTLPDNTVALGTKTTGDYVASLVAGTGITLSNNSGEGTTPTIAIGQAVGTTSNVTFNDLTVSGNLTVSGTTTAINTETLTIDDNIIVLNNNVTGSPSENAGIEVERGTLANVLVRWNETSDKWEITNDGTIYGDVVSTSDTGTVSTTMVANGAITQGKLGDGSITNAKINASAEIVDTKLATISTAGKVANSATTATNLNTINAIVTRDANGAFSAGTITAALNGNASTATTLATARTIAGQSFNGSANISIAPTDLTGVTSTAAEINILDGATLSTAELNILDGVTATFDELNILDGAVLSTTELNYVDGVTSSIQTQLNAKAPTASPTFTGTVSGVSKSMVGLGNVDNTSDANKPISSATQTALDAKAPIASPTFTGTVSGVTKSMVGLGDVDNTSDSAKPISTATQTALDNKAPIASPTFTGTPSLPTGTTAVTQTAGNNTTALATTEFIQTALGNYRRMTSSDTAPTVGVSAGDFWYDTTGLNLYIYYGSAWVQITIDEPMFFELSELIGVVIDEDLLQNQTLRFDGVSGNWVNSAPRQNVSNSSLTSYGVTSTNSGGVVVLDSSSAVSVDLGTWINANIGEKVDIVQKGTGQVSITVSGAVSLVSPNNSVTTRVRYSTVTATCIGTNLFLLSGDLA